MPIRIIIKGKIIMKKAFNLMNKKAQEEDLSQTISLSDGSSIEIKDDPIGGGGQVVPDHRQTSYWDHN